MASPGARSRLPPLDWIRQVLPLAGACACACSCAGCSSSPERDLRDGDVRGPTAAPYCGIAVDVYACRDEVARLREADVEVGSSFEGMCMGYGGTHPPAHLGRVDADRDMCTLNIHNDCSHWYQAHSGAWTCARDYGRGKSPDDCRGRYFFLWDEPATQGLSAEWAAEQWKAHVDRWPSEMAALRDRGTRITSPMFSDYGGPSQEKFQSFFEHCGDGCSDPHSPYFVDVLATNQWLIGSSSHHADNEQWIKNEVAKISSANGDRPVILGNFGWIGATTADQHAEAIRNSLIWDQSWSGLEAVFYFAATDYGGGSAHNLLSEKTSSGSTLAEVLVERCRVQGA